MFAHTQFRIFLLLAFANVLLWSSATPVKAQSVSGKTATQVRKPYVGVASWYGEQDQGRRMANGQRFDRYKLTAASWYFPLGTKLRVVNLQNGKAELVTITDRGPNLRLKNRIIDLSEAAASRLGYIEQGLTSVILFPLVAVEPKGAEINAALMDPGARNPH